MVEPHLLSFLFLCVFLVFLLFGLGSIYFYGIMFGRYVWQRGRFFSRHCRLFQLRKLKLEHCPASHYVYAPYSCAYFSTFLVMCLKAVALLEPVAASYPFPHQRHIIIDRYLRHSFDAKNIQTNIICIANMKQTHSNVNVLRFKLENVRHLSSCEIQEYL